MSRLKEIHDYLISLGKKEENLKQLDRKEFANGK